MLSDIATNTLALLAIVEPLGVLPLFLRATAYSTPQEQKGYARFLASVVVIALLLAALLGNRILQILSISLASMRVGGGMIVLMVAMAMVLGQQNAVKRTPAEAQQAADPESLGIVPLGIPLLVGPAAFSFMLAHSTWSQPRDLVAMVLPPIIVGLVTWAVLHSATALHGRMTPATLNVIERIAGFLLAGIAVELMASGLRELFPVLGAAGQ